jgi:hypothetical protein
VLLVRASGFHTTIHGCPPNFSGGIHDRRRWRMFFPSPISHFELPTSNFLRSASCGTALRWLRAIAAQFANGAMDRLITHCLTLTPVLIGSMTRRWRLSVRSKPSYRRVQSDAFAKMVCPQDRFLTRFSSLSPEFAQFGQTSQKSLADVQLKRNKLPV